ncbi:hypothetical protein PHSY_000063 [Pseudozyma hubeiensis SY62]|uniref:Uncharacterized protein n=1 Tax=Pseudozyma hubeiensis (strain SY62) TaxID=1305764 RepID=R9NVL9_PSEHS|nr:hypothetical protein PHSY_000063 [Pseudozyma hubeiensis SY62]GAC92509.1 hypothetical protein PHSY_000063 [Pseudozyma hubeiensis SY62]
MPLSALSALRRLWQPPRTGSPLLTLGTTFSTVAFILPTPKHDEAQSQQRDKMEVESSLPSVPSDREAVYTALTQFDESDPEFQGGIQTIIGPMQSSGVAPEQIEETKKRAKVFFWSQKTGNQVDYADYSEWLKSNPANSAAEKAGDSDAVMASTSAPDKAEGGKEQDKEPYPASFDAIVELITTGKTDQIPGIRDIPLKINEEPPTQATMSRPLKPWEKAGTSASDAPSQVMPQTAAAATETPVSHMETGHQS